MTRFVTWSLAIVLAASTGPAAVGQPLRACPLEWARQPSHEDILKVYPKDSLRQGRPGTVRFTCAFARTGQLRACRLAMEFPEGHGFAQAAMWLIPLYQASAPCVAGASVSIPIRFQIDPARAD
jgi:hypothetical protein